MATIINPNFIAYAKATYATNTCTSYFKNIEAMLNFIGKPENEITKSDILLWLSEMNNQGLSNSSRKQHLDSVKAYFKHLAEEELIAKNPTIGTKVLNVSNKAKHHMDVEMMKNMVAHAKTNRDKAIILLYVTSGMRVSELTGLTIQQYQKMKANGDNRIDIISKRDKHRFVYFTKEAQEAIDKYLPMRINAKCDALFITSQGNPIARNNMNLALKKIARDAGVPFWEDMSNHQLRAGCATMYYENGMGLHDLQNLLGHSDVSTTLRYTKSCDESVSRQVMGMNIMKF